jgi:hypothetical protein
LLEAVDRALRLEFWARKQWQQKRLRRPRRNDIRIAGRRGEVEVSTRGRPNVCRAKSKSF